MKRLIPFVIIVGFLGFVICIPLILQPDSKRAPLAEFLSSRLGHPVQIAKLDASFVPPTLRLQGVIIGEARQPLLKVENMQVRLAFLPLFKGQYVPTKMTMDQWSLVVNRQPDGSWGWRKWTGPTEKWSSGAFSSLDLLEFHQGDIRLVDPSAHIPQELRVNAVEGALNRTQESLTLNGTLGGAALPSAVAVQAKGRFLMMPHWTGDIKITEDGRAVNIHVNDQDDVTGPQKTDRKTELTIESSQWRFDHAWAMFKFFARWPAYTLNSAQAPFLQDWHAQFLWQDGKGTFTHKAGLAGGQSDLSVQLQQSSASLKAIVTGDVKDIQVEALSPVLGDLSGLKEGKVSASTRNLELYVASSTYAGMRGAITVQVQQGRYVLSEGTLKHLARVKTLGYFRQKFPDMMQKGLPFNSLSVILEANGNVWTVDQSAWISTNIKAAGFGALDMEKQAGDAFVLLQLQEPNAALRKSIPSRYILGTGGAAKIRPIYGRMQGAWADWMLKALPSSKVPAKAQAAFRRSLH